VLLLLHDLVVGDDYRVVVTGPDGVHEHELVAGEPDSSLDEAIAAAGTFTATIERIDADTLAVLVVEPQPEVAESAVVVTADCPQPAGSTPMSGLASTGSTRGPLPLALVALGGLLAGGTAIVGRGIRRRG